MTAYYTSLNSTPLSFNFYPSMTYNYSVLSKNCIHKIFINFSLQLIRCFYAILKNHHLILSTILYSLSRFNFYGKKLFFITRNSWVLFFQAANARFGQNNAPSNPPAFTDSTSGKTYLLLNTEFLSKDFVLKSFDIRAITAGTIIIQVFILEHYQIHIY